MTKKVKDYSVIADLLKEYHEKEIDDKEIERILSDVDKISLFSVCYFLDLDRKYYEKELNKKNI